MTPDEIKKAQDLSKQVKNLGGYPRPPSKKTIPVEGNFNPVKPEVVVDTPKQIAKKLNSLVGAVESYVIKDIVKPEDVVEAIKNLKGNDRIDISHIRNGEQIARHFNNANNGFNMDDQRWHGGGSSGSGSGTVTSVSVVTANGVSGSVANPTTTPAITLTLGAITPSSVVASGSMSGSNLSGTNTGDQIISDATITTSDITTNNVSTSKHGFTPKLPNDATKYLDGAGNYTVPSGTAVTLFPHGVGSTTDSGISFVDDVTASFGQLDITHKITVNKISIRTNGNYTTNSTFDLAMYSEDGQTRYFNVTSPDINAGDTVFTTSVASVTLLPGIYYIGIVANSVSVDLQLDGWFTGSSSPGLSVVTSEPVITGFMAVSSGTLPSTLNPISDLTALTSTIQIRLDN